MFAIPHRALTKVSRVGFHGKVCSFFRSGLSQDPISNENNPIDKPIFGLSHLGQLFDLGFPLSLFVLDL